MKDERVEGAPARRALLVLLLFVAAAAIAAVRLFAQGTVPGRLQAGRWLDVTGNLGGTHWGDGGVLSLVGVPGQNEIIAGVSERGLWASMQGGLAWTQLGVEGQITNRPTQIIVDPKDSKNIWTSGYYGPGVFKSTDGGR